MDNKEKRDNGLAYISDEEIMREQAQIRKLTQAYNEADRSDFKKLSKMLKNLLGECGENSIINPPFYCDYAKHIFIGKNFFANYNLTILDVAKVTIGDNVKFGPNVSIYTAGHPIHHIARNLGYEYGMPVKIKDNVWIGGCTVITAGVTIGENSVIGAGSVVTKDIPANVIAVGNPCKVLREITDDDMPYYYKDRKFDEETLKDIYGDDDQ